MHAVNKLIFVLSLLFLASNVTADEPEASGMEMVKLAYDKMKLAVAESGKAVEECMAMERQNKLSAAVFPKLLLSEDEWITAISYLFIHAANRCNEAAYASALMTVSQLGFIVKKIVGKNLTEYLSNGAAEGDVGILFYTTSVSMFQNEVKYRKIDTKARQILEAIPELNKPFNPLAANEALGLNPD